MSFSTQSKRPKHEEFKSPGATDLGIKPYSFCFASFTSAEVTWLESFDRITAASAGKSTSSSVSIVVSECKWANV